MPVLRQSTVQEEEPEKGPRARTRRLMIDTATRLMRSGATPSVSEVAEAAGVSRATAYRYFPSQSAMVHAVVAQGLGPILSWTSTSGDAEERVAGLIETGLPRIEAFEATFKAALKFALEQWGRQEAGTLGAEPHFVRGHRIDLLRDALKPLYGKLAPTEIDRLAQALSLVFGVEALIVLKDIWGLDGKSARDVSLWAARALVRTASADGSVNDAETPR